MDACPHDIVQRYDTYFRDPAVERWACQECGNEFFPTRPPGWFQIWRETRKLRRELAGE